MCHGGQVGVVSRAIIAIHSKDDLPRPSPSSPPLEDVWAGLGLPRPLMKFRGRDPLGLHVLLHLLPFAHVQGNRSGHLINASPMSYPCLWDLCSFSRCTDRLCEKRLANIDSSWRMEEIKEKKGERGLSKKERGNKWCTERSWMIYAIESSLFLGKQHLDFLVSDWESLVLGFPSNLSRK